MRQVPLPWQVALNSDGNANFSGKNIVIPMKNTDKVGTR